MAEDEDLTIDRALDLLDRAHLLAKAVVVAAPSPQQALDWAAAFYRAADQTRRKAVELRGETAARIWSDEEFAIALHVVAERYGVSEQRASQIIKEAEAAAEAAKGE